jgi:cyclopropane fatty-acyl-phospholipid synthase-like methyltransferase
MRWRAAYRLGFHPWEDAENCPEFVSALTHLVAKEEAGREPPYGRALDVGTGSGIWAIFLAHRGWEVTGVDLVEEPLVRARARAEQEGVDVRFVQRDITQLRPDEVDRGFRLVVDTGTFHDLDPAGQVGMGRATEAVTVPEAAVILTVWPRRRRPLIRGADRSEVTASFPGWRITDFMPSGYVPPKALELVLRSDEHLYRLQREI